MSSQKYNECDTFVRNKVFEQLKKNVIKMLQNQNIVPTNKPVCLHNNFPRDYVNLRKAIDTNN